jgi:hypothetical protein
MRYILSHFFFNRMPAIPKHARTSHQRRRPAGTAVNEDTTHAEHVGGLHNLPEETTLQDQWDEQLQTPHSRSLLKAMAEKALQEHQAGKTTQGGFGAYEIV